MAWSILSLLPASDGTRFLISLFHTPSPAARELCHQAVRAGWLKAAPNYRVERQSCPGHDLLFCREGAGLVMIRERILSRHRSRPLPPTQRPPLRSGRASQAIGRPWPGILTSAI